MAFYIFAGICSACAVIFLLLKFDIKKVLYFDVLIDASSSYLPHGSVLRIVRWHDGSGDRWCAHKHYALVYEAHHRLLQTCQTSSLVQMARS